MPLSFPCRLSLPLFVSFCLSSYLFTLHLSPSPSSHPVSLPLFVSFCLPASLSVSLHLSMSFFLLRSVALFPPLSRHVSLSRPISPYRLLHLPISLFLYVRLSVSLRHSFNLPHSIPLPPPASFRLLLFLSPSSPLYLSLYLSISPPLHLARAISGFSDSCRLPSCYLSFPYSLFIFLCSCLSFCAWTYMFARHERWGAGGVFDGRSVVIFRPCGATVVVCAQPPEMKMAKCYP